MAKRGGMRSDRGPSDSGDGGFGKDKKISNDFGTYEEDGSAWIRGYVGGEVPGGKHRFGDSEDWDGDEGEPDDCCEHGEGAEGFSKADLRRGYKTVK